MVALAPLNIGGWDHKFDATQQYTGGECGGMQRFVDSDVQHDGGTSPSLYELRVRIAPGPDGPAVSLGPAQGDDPFVGFRFPRYETASSVLVTDETISPCFNSSSSSRTNLLSRGVFDFYAESKQNVQETASTGPPVCDSAGTCVVRAEGTSSWSYGPEYGGDDLSGSMAINWWVNVEIGPSGGRCDGVKTKRTSRRHKAITNVRAAPDIDWYRAKVTVTYCVKKGKAWITDMKLKPTIQNGAIPRLLRKFGWLSVNPEEPEYSPIRKGGAVHASASTTYAMCFDPIVLLDKFGLKERIKKRMKEPLRKALKNILRKSGITKIDATVREKAVKAFRDKVDHAFKKGTITTWLKERRVPIRIARLAERAGKKNETKLKLLLKDLVASAMETGRYDNLTAHGASELMINDAFRRVGKATAFCGGRAAKKSNFRMWTVTYDAERNGRKIRISKDDVYKHPILTVRRY